MDLSIQPEFLPEINAAGLRIIGQKFRRSLGQNMPLAHHVGVVGDRERLPDVVIRDQNSQSPFREAADDVLNVLHRNGVYGPAIDF